MAQFQSRPVEFSASSPNFSLHSAQSTFASRQPTVQESTIRAEGPHLFISADVFPITEENSERIKKRIRKFEYDSFTVRPPQGYYIFFADSKEGEMRAERCYTSLNCMSLNGYTVTLKYHQSGSRLPPILKIGQLEQPGVQSYSNDPVSHNPFSSVGTRVDESVENNTVGKKKRPQACEECRRLKRRCTHDIVLQRPQQAEKDSTSPLTHSAAQWNGSGSRVATRELPRNEILGWRHFAPHHSSPTQNRQWTAASGSARSPTFHSASPPTAHAAHPTTGLSSHSSHILKSPTSNFLRPSASFGTPFSAQAHPGAPGTSTPSENRPQFSPALQSPLKNTQLGSLTYSSSPSAQETHGLYGPAINHEPASQPSAPGVEEARAENWGSLPKKIPRTKLQHSHDDIRNESREATPSDVASAPSSSAPPKCWKCKRANGELIRCKCKRYYHWCCNQPPLIKQENRDQWRCEVCVRKANSRSSTLREEGTTATVPLLVNGSSNLDEVQQTTSTGSGRLPLHRNTLQASSNPAGLAASHNGTTPPGGSRSRSVSMEISSPEASPAPPKTPSDEEVMPSPTEIPETPDAADSVKKSAHESQHEAIVTDIPSEGPFNTPSITDLSQKHMASDVALEYSTVQAERVLDEDLMKPDLTYVDLITAALREASQEGFTAPEVCDWIRSKYDYYMKKFPLPRLQNSISAYLSMRREFIKHPPPLGSNSKLSKWTLASSRSPSSQDTKPRPAKRPRIRSPSDLDRNSPSTPAKRSPPMTRRHPDDANDVALPAGECDEYRVKNVEGAAPDQVGRIKPVIKKWESLQDVEVGLVANIECRVGDIVKVRLDGGFEFARVQEMKVTKDGIIGVSILWFCSKPEMEKKISQEDERREWPESCDCIITNSLEVVKLGTISGKASASELDRLHLFPKILDVFARGARKSDTAKIRKQNDRDIVWVSIPQPTKPVPTAALSLAGEQHPPISERDAPRSKPAAVARLADPPAQQEPRQAKATTAEKASQDEGSEGVKSNNTRATSLKRKRRLGEDSDDENDAVADFESRGHEENVGEKLRRGPSSAIRSSSTSLSRLLKSELPQLLHDKMNERKLAEEDFATMKQILNLSKGLNLSPTGPWKRSRTEWLEYPALLDKMEADLNILKGTLKDMRDSIVDQIDWLPSDASGSSPSRKRKFEEQHTEPKRIAKAARVTYETYDTMGELLDQFPELHEHSPPPADVPTARKKKHSKSDTSSETRRQKSPLPKVNEQKKQIEDTSSMGKRYYKSRHMAFAKQGGDLVLRDERKDRHGKFLHPEAIVNIGPLQPGDEERLSLFKASDGREWGWARVGNTFARVSEQRK